MAPRKKKAGGSPRLYYFAFTKFQIGLLLVGAGVLLTFSFILGFVVGGRAVCLQKRVRVL